MNNYEIVNMPLSPKYYCDINRSTRPEVFCKKNFLRNFAKFGGKCLCQRLFFKKESLAQVVSCEICEISKNTFSTEHLWWLLLDKQEINFNVNNLDFNHRVFLA